uniref:Uncharacterized protein n=1 Tax=Tetranychus urticae TaxID=32264 RepID=T1KSG0_TETUR
MVFVAIFGHSSAWRMRRLNMPNRPAFTLPSDVLYTGSPTTPNYDGTSTTGGTTIGTTGFMNIL